MPSCLQAGLYAFLYPGIGKTGFAVAAPLGSTTVGVRFRFCTHAEPMPSTWPLALNLIGAPSVIFSVMLVWRIASARVFGSVAFARLKASAAIRIASKVNPAFSPWNTSLSFGFCLRNAFSTTLVTLAFGLYQGTLEIEYSDSLPSVL